jgi:radical SAM superfamily enzyme YgiQ (UPF0313 family)
MNLYPNFRRKKERRLLLIAMSGVRVRDEQLGKFGMTLPGFIERGKTIASMPSLSLLIVAAHTPPHWEIEYLEIDDVEEGKFQLLKKVEQFDLIGISSLTARAYDAYEIADTVRSCAVPVVMGGLHASVAPEEAGHHATSVVQGEAEWVWPQVIRDYEAAGLKKLYSSFNIASDQRLFFEELPTPRYDLIDPRLYNRIPLQTTRGCPLDCVFCGASRMISKFKTKPIPSIQRELEEILKIWNRPFIELADDNTFLRKDWSRDLISLLAQYKVHWFTETDISIADDTSLLEQLAASGCAQLLIGLESPSADHLLGIDANDWKFRKHEKYIRSIEKIQSFGISVNGCFILGLDSHDVSIFETTKSFVNNSKLSEVQITLLTPFPGTELYTQFRRDKRLLRESFWDECTLFDVTYHPSRMSTQELKQGFQWLMGELYNPSQTAIRRQIFRNCVRERHGVR